MKRWSTRWRSEHRGLNLMSRTAIFVLAVLGLHVRDIGAQTVNWGPAGDGGSGDWDVTTANWFDGSVSTTWTQGGSAIFAGTAGTVRLTTPVLAQDISLNTNGYLLSGGMLTFSTGLTSTISVAPSTTSIINSVIAGSNQIVINGGGTLRLGGANTFTGLLDIQAGTVILDNGNLRGRTASAGSTAGATSVAAGATLDLNARNVGFERLILNGGTIINSGGPDALITNVPLVINASSFVDAINGWISIGSTTGSGSLTISSLNAKGVFNNTIGTWAHTGGTIINSGELDLYSPTGVTQPLITGGPITINGGGLNTFGSLSRLSSNVGVTVNGGSLALEMAPETIAFLAGTGGVVTLGTGPLSTVTLTAGADGSSTNYAGRIQGMGGLQKLVLERGPCPA